MAESKRRGSTNVHYFRAGMRGPVIHELARRLGDQKFGKLIDKLLGNVRESILQAANEKDGRFASECWQDVWIDPDTGRMCWRTCCRGPDGAVQCSTPMCAGGLDIDKGMFRRLEDTGPLEPFPLPPIVDEPDLGPPHPPGP